MAKPKDPEKETEIVAEEESEETLKPNEDGTVTVPLQEPKDIEEKKPEKDEPKYVTQDELKKVQNSIAYQTRMVEKALKTEPQAAPVELTGEQKKIDEVAQVDWQEGVRMVMREEYKVQRKAELEDEAKQQKATSDLHVMQQSKDFVLNTYPDLASDTSDMTKLYIEAQNELGTKDQSFFGNTYGPIAAMRLMEDKMRQQGIPLPGVSEMAQTEIQRRANVGAASVTPAAPATNKGAYILTVEQKQFCDQNNIPYAMYAKNASALENTSSLEA